MKYKYSAPPHHFFDYGDIAIRSKPITNREYLIFLCWNIYSYDHLNDAEFTLKLLPSPAIQKNKSALTSTLQVLTSEGYLDNTPIFNAALLDKPCTKLNNFQLEALYQWMYDRCIEDKLIRTGVLNSNMDAAGDQIFNLEAFITELHYGDFRRYPRPAPSSDFYLACFRPPFKSESFLVPDNYPVRNSRKTPKSKEYPLSKKDFLWRWNKHFIEHKGNDTSLKIKGRRITLPTKKTDEPLRPVLFTLTSDSSFFASTKYLDETPKVETDAYGKLPFTYMGKNTFGRPVVLTSYEFLAKKNNYHTPQYYYLVYCPEVKFGHWPR